jgi:hypothetical protein
VRPLDARFVSHPYDGVPGDGSVAAVALVAAALGLPACALCHDPEAVPALAGDRAYGPDHLYLVCDRCGGRWQRCDAAHS